MVLWYSIIKIELNGKFFAEFRQDTLHLFAGYYVANFAFEFEMADSNDEIYNSMLVAYNYLVQKKG